jgi:hypothetical protein
VLAPMLPFILPERANVPPEDGKSSLDNLGGTPADNSKCRNGWL